MSTDFMTACLYEPIKDIVSRWKSKALQEQKEFVKKNKAIISEYDRLPLIKKINYDYRNALVNINHQLQVDFPWEFALQEEVTVNLGRLIKCVVQSYEDPAMRLVLIRPIDTVYKEPFIISEESIEQFVPEQERSGQLQLF